jgi:D-threonate/D-erythronate kinase
MLFLTLPRPRANVSAMLAGIQADDLTGACDTGAPFAARGLEPLVVIHDGHDPPPWPSVTPAVLVVDTETRYGRTEEARERARWTGSALKAASPRVVYKKLDSTLRGHVAAEIDGMLDGAGLEMAFLSPAFPAQHRGTVDGCLLVDGRPADETPVACDPAFPRTGSSVLGLLAAEGVRPIAVLPLATVRQGQDLVVSRLKRFAAVGGRVLAADAETGADLSTLAEAGWGRPLLLAGSAGLATALARRQACVATRRPERPGRPLLVVAGSAHPATRDQLSRLARRDGLTVLAPPDDDGAHDPARRRETVVRLATDARNRMDRDRPGALLLTGGETAIAVLRALEADGIRLVGQIEPGLALGALAGGPFDGLAVMTKAGGFGDADALVRVWEACL